MVGTYTFLLLTYFQSNVPYIIRAVVLNEYDAVSMSIIHGANVNEFGPVKSSATEKFTKPRKIKIFRTT